MDRDSPGTRPVIPGLSATHPTAPLADDAEPRVLVVARERGTRLALASLLLDAGLDVAAAPGFGIADLLGRTPERFDLLLVAQSAEETTWFGVPQLVRSVDPDLPVLVLELGTVHSPAVVDLARAALARWPTRDHVRAPLH